MRGDLGTLGVILGATIGGVREMSLLIFLKKINFGETWGMSDTWTTENF
jgi:hypothetical protein